MSQNNKTRITLIERIQNQDDEASWSEFVDIYYGFIYSTIRKMNIAPNDAEDIVQQVLLNLWKKLPEQDVCKLHRFRSWMCKVIKNRVIDFMRACDSEKQRREKAAQDVNCDHVKAISVAEIEAIADKEWKLHLTHLAIQRVKPLFSSSAMTVFKLSLEGIPSDRIAEQLGITEPTVYQLRSRVKRRIMEEINYLRETLEPEDVSI